MVDVRYDVPPTVRYDVIRTCTSATTYKGRVCLEDIHRTLCCSLYSLCATLFVNVIVEVGSYEQQTVILFLWLLSTPWVVPLLATCAPHDRLHGVICCLSSRPDIILQPSPCGVRRMRTTYCVRRRGAEKRTDPRRPAPNTAAART